MKTVTAKASFICPECGWEGSATTPHSQTFTSDGGRRRSYRCAQCGWEIPAHLAECWGITPQEARKEWREVYRGLEPQPVKS